MSNGAPDFLTVARGDDTEASGEKVIRRSSSFKRSERASSACLTRPVASDGSLLARAERSSSASLASGARASDINLTKFDKSPSATLTHTNGGQKSIIIEKSSDSPGSRSSIEFSGSQRSHSREHSFEKSLNSIIDKCSEKSLDLNLTLDSKSDVKSGQSDPSKSLDEAASSTSAKKSEKKKKSTPWYSAVGLFYEVYYMQLQLH